MRKLQGRGKEVETEGQEGAGTNVSDLRTKSLFAFVINNVRPSSPNKVVWSRKAAMGAAKRRRELRALGCLYARAYVDKDIRDGLFSGRMVGSVEIVRLAPRRFDDDNWQAAAKPIRDGVADAFGLRDDAVNLVWKYDQRRGQPKQYAVEIRIEVHQ